MLNKFSYIYYLKDIHICYYLVKLFDTFNCQSFESMSPHLPSTLKFINSSALVLPIFTIAIGLLASTACNTILYEENVVRVVPRISKASELLMLLFTFCTILRGMFSPKNIISGFKIPPQLLQAGTLKFSTCACYIYFIIIYYYVLQKLHIHIYM